MDFLNEEIINIVTNWFFSGGLKIVLILMVALLISKFSARIIEKLVRDVVVSSINTTATEERKREDTLINVFQATIRILLWIVVTMMILSELGLNIGPMIAAAGVAGLAFGFGGQYLIRDVISGLFIILENQYRVGDVVCFGKVCGLVEKVNLRLTVIRDLDGIVHHVPNGEIKTASNLSKNFSRVNLDIGVAYSSDIEKVENVVNAVGRSIAEDPLWRDRILKTPEFIRVSDFADSSIIIKILGDTQPLEQWAVAGELRKRLKIAFDREGIEIPFPQRVIHTVNR